VAHTLAGLQCCGFGKGVSHASEALHAAA